MNSKKQILAALMGLLLIAIPEGHAALVKGTCSIGGSEHPGMYAVTLNVHIINTSETPLYVPTKGYTYDSNVDLETNVTKIFGVIKEEKSITGYNMPFSEGDLRIVKLLKDEVAVVHMQFELKENKLTHAYDIKIELNDPLARRYNYSPGLYHCSVELPGSRKAREAARP